MTFCTLRDAEGGIAGFSALKIYSMFSVIKTGIRRQESKSYIFTDLVSLSISSQNTWVINIYRFIPGVIFFKTPNHIPEPSSASLGASLLEPGDPRVPRGCRVDYKMLKVCVSHSWALEYWLPGALRRWTHFVRWFFKLRALMRLPQSGEHTAVYWSC